MHVDPPAEHKAYLHRSGRTARAGAGGTVVTIATPDQAGEVRTLARQAGITPEVSAIKPGAREITALTGPAAPYVEPAPAAAPQPQGQAAADAVAAARARGRSAARRVRRRQRPRAAAAGPGARAVRPAGADPRRAGRARRLRRPRRSFSARSRRGGR